VVCIHNKNNNPHKLDVGGSVKGSFGIKQNWKQFSFAVDVIAFILVEMKNILILHSR